MNGSPKLHEAPRNMSGISAALKPHARKSRISHVLGPHDAPANKLPDRDHTSAQAKDVAPVSIMSVDQAPAEIQAAPPQAIEHEVGQTVGEAPASRWSDANAAMNPRPNGDVREGTQTIGILTVLILIVLAAFEVVTSLSRRTYTRRVLEFGAEQRPERLPDLARPDLSWARPKTIESEAGAAVKHALDTIAAAQAEMGSSR